MVAPQNVQNDLHAAGRAATGPAVVVEGGHTLEHLAALLQHPNAAVDEVVAQFRNDGLYTGGLCLSKDVARSISSSIRKGINFIIPLYHY